MRRKKESEACQKVGVEIRVRIAPGRSSSDDLINSKLTTLKIIDWTLSHDGTETGSRFAQAANTATARSL